MSHNGTLQYTEVGSYGNRIHIDCSKENAGAGNSSVITGTQSLPKLFSVRFGKVGSNDMTQ